MRKGRDGAWELYNLQADRTELNDLAAQEPGRAKELAAQWQAWAKRTNVVPYPSERAKKKEAKAAKAKARS